MQNQTRNLVLLSVVLVISILSSSLFSPVEAAPLLQPTFSKQFTPDTIGPGSVSTLTFTIMNGSGSPVTDLAFTDTLPASVTIAAPANASTTCNDAGPATLTAPDGGSTITFADGSVALSSSCTVSVDVTSSTAGTHSNTSSDLTSSDGNSGSANANLTVDNSLPGFSKSFSPGTVPFGGRSTLTFLIDNTANATQRFFLSFSDTLPAGMKVANPANGSTDCVSGSFTGGTLTATPGDNVISISNTGGPASFAVDANSNCTVSVDVIATGNGTLANSSGELTSTSGGPTVSSGKASAPLTVTRDDLVLVKSFANDPAPPGGTVDLVFTLTNFDRNNLANSIAFTDDLNATLSGLTATGLAGDCGGSFSGTSTLSLTGGSLAANGGTCTMTATLQIPIGAATGTYPNTTSNVTSSLAGSPHSPASEPLYIEPAPLLTKNFTPGLVASGGTVTLEFDITNTSPTSAASDIAFIDELTTFLPFPVSATLPSGDPCGTGSSIGLISLGTDRQGLSLTGGNLAQGASCTFSVDLDIPVDLANGTYTNTSEDITATVDGNTVTGSPATADLNVVGPPDFAKFFANLSFPGETVDLVFELELSENAPTDATSIAFTDDLDATLSGLVATDLPQSDVCGAGSQISGTSTLSFTGGVLSSQERCVFTVTLQVPASAALGTYPNTTGNITADVGGLPTTGTMAQSDLIIGGLTLTKSFTDDPVLPGGTATLEFNIVNSTTLTATEMSFSDSLNGALSGLTSTSGTLINICGAGSQLSGTSNLIFANGNLEPGESCTISVDVSVPAGAAEGTYGNVTSNLSTKLNNQTFTLEPAVDSLNVVEEVLLFSKAFGSDAAAAGDTVTLTFMMTNSFTSTAVTNIAFTDDLDAALSGLVATGLPQSNVCGTGSQISGTSTLSLTGGSLGPGADCSFDVTLQIPGGASAGIITNNTSQPTGSVGGLTASGNAATDELEIVTTGIIIIDKVTSHLGTTDSFTITLEGGPSALDRTLVITDGTPPVSIDVLSGSGYKVAETGIPAAWTLTSATCSDSSPISNINISANETVTCTFLNTLRSFDLAISKNAVRDNINKLITYTVTAVNNGPTTVSDATITDPVPTGITAFTGWSCAASGGVTCPNSNGNGPLDETAGSFPSGAELVYTIQATLVSSDTGVSNTASITTSFGSGLGDTQPGNNSVTNISPPFGVFVLYVPLILKNAVPLPDLVVDSVVATETGVTVVIRNRGLAPATGFWVDVYYDPGSTPTGQPWQSISSQGLRWGITTAIAGGSTLTLSADASDPFFFPTVSVPFQAPFPTAGLCTFLRER